MKITIDGVECTANKGETIMQTARNNGLFIPGLCYSEAVDGGTCCRLCMVEVEEQGWNRLVAACAYLVKDGMSVITDSDKVSRIRKTMLKLLHLQAPESEMVRALMEKYGVEPETRLSRKESGCVMCGLCVKACEVLGSSVISTVSRGINKKISTPYGQPSEDCTGCAACALICPANCIEVKQTGRTRTIWNREFEMAICEGCGKSFATHAQYQATLAKAGLPDDGTITCEECRRKSSVRVFSRILS